MSENPCQKEQEEFDKASMEYVAASHSVSALTSNLTEEEVQRRGPMPPAHLEELTAAIKLRNEKEEAFIEADKKWAECQERNK